MKLKPKLNNFYKKNKDIIDYLLKFSFVIVFYGIATNFAYWHILPAKLLPLKFSFFKELFRSLAFGFLWYIIKVELPSIIKSCRRELPNLRH